MSSLLSQRLNVTHFSDQQEQRQDAVSEFDNWTINLFSNSVFNANRSAIRDCLIYCRTAILSGKWTLGQAENEVFTFAKNNNIPLRNS